MRAVELRTEYMKNPVGVDFTNPRLMWKCEGDVRQEAFQVICKDESEKILWDSGKIESSCMKVTYRGEKLESCSIVRWSVKLWNEKDEEGEWAEEASFELGLLHPQDWRAKWIAGDYKPKKKKRYPVDYFRKVLEIKRKVLKARLYITACGLYEARLDGKKIGNQCLTPGITDYRKRVQYQTYDVTDFLSKGKHQMQVALADGWYRGSTGAWGLRNQYGTETKFMAQLEICYEDGSRTTMRSGESWCWSNGGPIRFADNKDGEIYDARKDNFQGAIWKKVKVTKHNVVPTASDNFPLVEQENLINPKLILTPSGKKVLDFGQNIAGIVSFSVNAKEGQRIFLRFGELMKDGEFTQKNIQCVKKNFASPLQQVEYFCKEGLNEYKTTFAIFGYQYIEVEADMEIDPSAFTAIAVYSDFETTFTFDSSNQLLNQFVKNTLWSLKNNSADLPTDCPTRERHGWSGDAQIFVNTASYMVNYAPFALKYENDLCDWQKKNGNFPQIAPEGGTDSYMKTMNGSVGWSDAGILIPYRLWKKYGDRSIIEKYYENMKHYAQYMISRTGKTQPIISEKTGLSKEDSKYLYNIGQHYGEWAEPSDVHAMSYKDFMSSRPEEATAYLSYVMGVMVEIAQELGKKQDLPLYIEYHDGAKQTYQKLRKQPKYSLDTDRQARLVRPLYMNLLDQADTEYAKKRLIQAMDHYKWRIGTGFLSTPFILYVLSDIDPEYAYKLLENEEKPGWLCMPKAGATTIWEDWEGPDSDNGKGGGIASLNHYSKGAVCEWIFEKMCGIKVDGENHFKIEPVPGGHFTYAGMSYDSVYGTVSCKWKKQEDGRLAYDIVIPANTSAEIVVKGWKVQNVGAGEYHIEVKE